MSRNNGKQRWGTIPENLLDPTGGSMNEPPILPGYQGLPFRGKPFDLKSDDPDHAQPQIAQKVHVDIFDLSKDDDLKQYRHVSQLIANGFAIISKEDVKYDENSKNWRVFIRWLEVFTYDPSKGQQHGRDL